MSMMKGPVVPTALDFTGVIETHEGAIIPVEQVASRLRELADQLENRSGIMLFARESYSFESKATRPDDLAASYITFVLELGKRIGPSEAEEKYGALWLAHQEKCQQCREQNHCPEGEKLLQQYMEQGQKTEGEPV